MPAERKGRVIAVEIGPTGLYPGKSPRFQRKAAAFERCLEPDAGDRHVRLCVQRRLACSAGAETCRGNSQEPRSSDSRVAENQDLKPIDKVSLGEITSHRAVTTVNVEVASKVSGSE